MDSKFRMFINMIYKEFENKIRWPCFYVKMYYLDNTSCKFNDITLRISQKKLKPSYTHGAYIMESSSRRVKLNFFSNLSWV